MIGNGLPAIPMKLYNKIASLEFIDLSELKLAGTSINPDTDPHLWYALIATWNKKEKKKITAQHIFHSGPVQVVHIYLILEWGIYSLSASPASP